MILSHFMYDGQFFLCDYCKVGKCVMPSVLKSVQIPAFSRIEGKNMKYINFKF